MSEARFWYEHQPEDDTYRVFTELNGVTASCVVSSMHLIEEKRKPLLAACLPFKHAIVSFET